MKKIIFFFLCFLVYTIGSTQTQLRKGSFNNGATLNSSSTSYQLKSGVNSSAGFRVEATQATGVIESDSSALEALFLATGGANWNNSTNWFAGPVSTWHGITVTGDRVTKIDLSYNNLVGGLPLELGNLDALDSINFDTNQLTTVPSEITNITGLVYLNLDRNALTFLPDISSISALQFLQANYNFLDFDDIVPNSGISGAFFGGQNIPGSGYDSSMVVGNTITIDLTGAVDDGGTGNNNYQWRKDGVDIPGATSDSYTIASFTHADEGTYQLFVNNSSDLTGATVSSNQFNLFINDTMYWIGDGGDWKDINHWSYTSGTVDPVAALPGPHDDVRFDSQSFTTTGQVLYVEDDASTVGVEFRNMDWTGVTNNPTFQIRTTTSDWIYNLVYGSLIFDENMTIDFQGAEFYFASDEDYFIDTKGHYLGDNCWMSINNDFSGNSHPVVCTVLSEINPAGAYVSNGTLNLNGNSWTEKDSYFWLQGNNTTLDLRGSSIDVTSFYLNASTTGATILSDSSVVTIHNELRLNEAPLDHVILADTAKVRIYSHTFNTLEIAAGANVAFHSDSTHYVINNLIMNGTSVEPISVSASTPGAAAIINKPAGLVEVNNVSFTDNTVTGGATFNAYNSIDNGNVTGWNFVTGKVLFEQDSLALRAFYNATNGASWTDNTNWLTTSPDSWLGVTIADNRVTGLNLPTNNLTGSLPNEIGNLTQLESLQLHDNNLTDTIPASLWELPFLGYVSINSNQFTGSLPATMGSHGNFSYLELSDNAFSGQIPAGLSVNGALNYLNLSNNQFDGAVPNDFVNLEGLETLYLTNNNLVDLPDLSALSAITILGLDDNFFTFEDLEPNAAITGVSYSSMKNPRQAYDTLLNIGETLNMASNTAGSANLYQWFKNGAPLATTANYAIAAAQFTDEGQYYCDISNSIATQLTLRSDTFNIKVSSLERDAIALQNIFDAMGGTGWSSATNWGDSDISIWEGVTVTNNRVTGWSMPANNIAGDMPEDINDIRQLTSVAINGNLIESIPLITLPNITNFDVSENMLDFGDLEPNAAVTGIAYADQDSIGIGGQVLVDADADNFFEIVTPGTANNYQWFKDGVAISGATYDTLTIPTVRRAEMGEYYLEVTNDNVPGLTLTTKTFDLLAQTSVSGTITLDGANPMTNGNVLFLKITSTEGYDTTSVVQVNTDGTYEHTDIILDDYITIAQPNVSTHPDYIPTYYSGTIFWEEADTIFLDSMTVALNLVLEGGPEEATTGEGSIFGVLEEEVPDGGRVEAKKRVEGAGVSVRRRNRQGRGEDDEYILVGYVYTNGDGEFDFNQLDPDEYLINVQYPGYPMDEASDIFITVGDGRFGNVEVGALVDQGKISVRIVEITGVDKTPEFAQVEFYPNPAKETVYLSNLPIDKSFTAIITDTNGKAVHTDTQPHDGIDVGSLLNGIYMLRILDENNQSVITSRLMITK